MNENLFDEAIEVPDVHEKGIPIFLKIIYITFPIGGLIAFFLYWNGSYGLLDRGSWKALQQAANTTYPFQKGDEHPKEVIISPSQMNDSNW